MLYCYSWFPFYFLLLNLDILGILPEANQLMLQVLLFLTCSIRDFFPVCPFSFATWNLSLHSKGFSFAIHIIFVLFDKAIRLKCCIPSLKRRLLSSAVFSVIIGQLIHFLKSYDSHISFSIYFFPFWGPRFRFNFYFLGLDIIFEGCLIIFMSLFFGSWLFKITFW